MPLLVININQNKSLMQEHMELLPKVFFFSLHKQKLTAQYTKLYRSRSISEHVPIGGRINVHYNMQTVDISAMQSELPHASIELLELPEGSMLIVYV